MSMRQDTFANLLQRTGLGAHALLVRSGAMRLPGIRSIFGLAYERYKLHLEKGAVAALSRIVSPGSLVIDVGANVGFFTTRFADWVGKDGFVIAIEPDLENFEVLERRLSERDRVKRINAVAAGEKGVLRLKRNEVHPGDHRIALDGDGVEVASVRLDDLLQLCPDRPLTLVKIDVQGAEMIVLSGASSILADKSPALLIEIDEAQLREFGTSSAALLDHLESFGYKSNELDASGATTPIDRSGLQKRLAESGYLDILFLKSRATAA
ncbi:FkbM family methyltransferase [Bradyrhizobium sp. LHD-71]|uniref:FkbM family methyltransferase n=1 Tax=Bradyrhizobium sp. LHD-71 TaxID=3072141 RepID=UPI00280F52A5|nr:FkbM family methyltransferase [Bradyrhizobium sp. LHD-71]MDQ8728362.1 FkbM family methyltransferase [Bradyrhizobium sp. LHD-71]